MKKLSLKAAALMILAIISVSACFNEKKEDNNKSTIVKADSNFLGAEYEIEGKVEVKALNSNLIVSKYSAEKNKTTVAVTSGHETFLGEELFELSQATIVSKKSTVTTEDFANEGLSVVKRSGEVLLGDFDGDNKVGITDLTVFSNNYSGTNSKYDIYPSVKGTGDWEDIYCVASPDGKVDLKDFIVLAYNFGTEIIINNPDVNLDLTLSTEEVEVGKTFSLNLSAVSELENLSAYEIEILFPWNISFEKLNGLSDNVISMTKVEASESDSFERLRISIAGKENSLINLDGALLSVEFKAKSESDSSVISVETLKLIDKDIKEVDVESSSNNVNISVKKAEIIIDPIDPEDLEGAITKANYSTNAVGVGKNTTITIDGSLSDWSEDMKIAQGAAWDVANNWKGGHENCVLDSYSLYAAWDDDNLYIGWQMVNTTDTWANPGDGPLSDGGRVLDVPLVIALNTGKKTAMTGKMANGKLIWDALQLEFKTRVDHLFLMSGKVGLGTPGMFTAADATGGASYDAEFCQSFKLTGIQYKMSMAALPSKIIGLESSTSPEDVYDENANWIDMMTKGHDTTYDSFYEMSIPLSVLGIDKSYIETNGIGVMQIATRGVSAIDSMPHDPSMLDNALEDCAVDPSTSHEKDDTDVITVPLARVGKK